MSVLRELLVEFTTRVDDKPLTKLDRTLKTVKKAAGALGLALSAKAFGDFINKNAEIADKLGKTEQALQISTEALQEWSYAATLSGASGAQFEMSVRQLLMSLKELEQDKTGQGAKAKAFKQLGVAARDAHGNLRPIGDLLPAIAEGIAATDNPSKKATLALTLFGESATPLIPLFNEGAKGIKRMREEFRSLGGGFDRDAIQKSAEYNDQLTRLDTAMTSIKSGILSGLLPALTALGDVVTKATSFVAWITHKTYLFEAALVVLGAKIVWVGATWIATNKAMLAASIRTWAPLVARFALVLAKVMLIVAAVEDVITTFQGGKSVIQRTIDAIGGIGTTREIIISVRQAFDDLFYSISKVGHALGILDSPGLSPDEIREQRRREAVAAGDADGFVAEGPAGLSREEALDSFREHRRRYLLQHVDDVTDADRGDGLAPKPGAKRAPQPGPRITAPTSKSWVGSSHVKAPPVAAQHRVEAPLTLNITTTSDPQTTKRAVEGVLNRHVDMIKSALDRRATP